jgi:hypothetical protein
VSSGYGGARLVNPPVRINFAGFQSDTYTLQRNGWQISVEELHETFQMRIAIKHPGFGVYGITAGVDFDMSRQEGMLDPLELPIMALHHNIRVQPPIALEHDMMKGFNPVDARPQVVMKEPMHIDDLMIFRPLKKESEIIIPQQSVSELLAKIHELQDPEQDRIRTDNRNRMRREMHKFNQETNNYDLGDTDIVAQVAILT